ncbi:hypothetical protein [Asanoa siamensis]|uniref:Uncharacterized protein n=1 Tax=Asanoa siamensis TaxID=926357 RepID=A0ABQ4CZQ2_9ACTN|nr:hypothetical protein [Asanoa siamensis]GIF76786.1 hypothetical protein Asi02nite_63040 [Asanoa siamensis]
MTTWRGVRKEFVGAWRSLQYDLSRARRKRPDGDETTELIFPGHAGQPGRRVAAGGFVLVSVAGAIGTYFAVVNGLGALLAPEAEQADETPASVVAGAAGTGQRPPEARLDRTVRIARQGGPLTVAGRQAAAGRAGSSDTRDGAPTGVGPAPDLVRDPGGPRPEQSEDPAPEPTEPPVPSESPSPSPHPTPTDEPSPSPSATAEPTDEVDDDGESRHHPRRQHRHDRDENP